MLSFANVENYHGLKVSLLMYIQDPNDIQLEIYYWSTSSDSKLLHNNIIIANKHQQYPRYFGKF